MGTCHLDIVIEPTHQGEILFQIECTAEIIYAVDEDGLSDWKIFDLRFDRIWSNDKVFKALLPLVDTEKVRDQLLEHLRDEGELGSSSLAADRADYHARVL